MWNYESAFNAEEPTIVKHVEKSYTGIETITLSRHAIAYVLRGRQYIYDGDRRRAVGRGEMLSLGIGRHYVESIPENGQPFEQIFIYYSPEELQRVLMHLSVTYHLTINNTHTCEKCRNQTCVVAEASPSIRNFFLNTNAYLRENDFHRDETAENIKMTELVYLIVTQGDGCIRNRLLASVDVAGENFEQVIYDHIFRAVPIEQLAEKTNRSLTSFKKEFRRHFNAPPHKWYVRQRLIHSRLLLISTNKSVSEIGNECSFPNTSHYIKLFKRAYKLTPAAYRALHLKAQQIQEVTPAEPKEALELIC
ncbi:MAG: AraC family transcriptional regulator [Rikenellaceae bacterium]|nr:AraC family transcriptional regulator [Rikenellaceae bacterium]